MLGRARFGCGDGSCLELFLVSLLTGWQSSSHMYGFNSSCFSAGVFAIGRCITGCRAVLPIWIMVGQGHTVLAVGAGVDCLDIFFSRLSFLFSFSLSLEWMDG